MKKEFFLIAIFFTILNSYSQDRKSFNAYRTEKHQKLDGFIDDKEWRNLKNLVNLHFGDQRQEVEKNPNGLQNHCIFHVR